VEDVEDTVDSTPDVEPTVEFSNTRSESDVEISVEEDDGLPINITKASSSFSSIREFGSFSSLVKGVQCCQTNMPWYRLAKVGSDYP
jgi:hypothetical protein